MYDNVDVDVVDDDDVDDVDDVVEEEEDDDVEDYNVDEEEDRSQDRDNRFVRAKTSRNALGHVTGATLYRNLQVKCRRQAGAP